MNSKNKGILFIILSAFFFAVMNVFVKLAGDLPSIQKSFFRNFIALLFALILLKKQHTSLHFSKKDLPILILRATFGTIGILCNFYAVDHLFVADASMLNKLSPFFVILFSYLLLKEKITLIQSFCVITAFLGSLFIIKPGFQNMSLIPAIIGTVGGMCAGIAYTMVRILGKRGVNGPFIVFFFSCFSCIVTLPYLVLNYHSMTTQQTLALLGAGFAAAGGQFAITAAYAHAPAKEISIYDYSQIIFATILGVLFLGQVPDTYSFIGYFIICSASLIMFLYNQKQQKAK